ncbi:MAG TPA: SAM-dependent methyltransferase [Bryobacteraceae bacterium]|nr:SAM-dependent methyltransferase [Bryobacteraceae bacterium]
MTPAGELLAAEIERQGPIPFRRFMEVALYHPQCGYYRQGRDPFGRGGDFYTAEQVQPVFGMLIAARVRQLWRDLGQPADFTVVELGAGRGEMAPAFSDWHYLPVEIGSGDLPRGFEGVIFSNEFFDALPVDVAVYTKSEYRQQLVTFDSGRFVWTLGDVVTEESGDYLRRYVPPPEEGWWSEVHLEALGWIERMARALQSGWVLTIDYGYTLPEVIRFPRGTLMSYRQHTALDDVLDEPGVRDITAHVNFTALERHGSAYGLHAERFETLAQTLLAAGEEEMTRALAGAGAAEELRRRLQLKTLLFGMGETFRVLWQRKEGKEFGGKSP